MFDVVVMVMRIGDNDDDDNVDDADDDNDDDADDQWRDQAPQEQRHPAGPTAETELFWAPSKHLLGWILSYTTACLQVGTLSYF